MVIGARGRHWRWRQSRDPWRGVGWNGPEQTHPGKSFDSLTISRGNRELLTLFVAVVSLTFSYSGAGGGLAFELPQHRFSGAGKGGN